MASVTLETLRRLVRERADMQTTAPGSAETQDDPELDGFINYALSAYHDLMKEMQRHEWSVTPLLTAEATGDGALTRWDMPDAAQLVVAVRWQTGQIWHNIPPFDHDERSQLLSAVPGVSFFQHRVVGRSVEILPAMRSNAPIEIDYWPEFEPLTSAASAFRCPYGWEEWPVWSAVVALFTKQERDATQAAASLMFHDRRIRALATRRAGALRVVDRWAERRIPQMYGWPRWSRRLVSG